MSLSNPYRWAVDLPPATRRRAALSTGGALSLVTALTLAAVLVPAGAGNAAPPPPDYVAGLGACSDPTFYQPTGTADDGSTVYSRFQFLYSYEISGAPGARYFRYVHAASTWTGTEWRGDPAQPTVQTWYCTTRSPVRTVPIPTPTPTDPTPSPTPGPTPTAGPTPSPTPDGRDCGEGRVLTGAEIARMVADAAANGATPEQVADLSGDPCAVLAGLLDGLEMQEPLLLAANQFEETADGHVCGTVRLRVPFKFRYAGWRGWPFGNVSLDDTVAHIDVRQYLCKDQMRVLLDNGSPVDYTVPNQPKATQPPNPEVDVNVFGFTWLMAISKGGVGNSGVSSAYWVSHRGFPKAGWRVTVELELTLLGAGGGGGFAAWKKTYTRTFLYTVDDIPDV